MWYSNPLEYFFKQTFTFQVFILTSLLFEGECLCAKPLPNFNICVIKTAFTLRRGICWFSSCFCCFLTLQLFCWFALARTALVHHCQRATGNDGLTWCLFCEPGVWHKSVPAAWTTTEFVKTKKLQKWQSMCESHWHFPICIRCLSSFTDNCVCFVLSLSPSQSKIMAEI